MSARCMKSTESRSITVGPRRWADVERAVGQRRAVAVELEVVVVAVVVVVHAVARARHTSGVSRRSGCVRRR